VIAPAAVRDGTAALHDTSQRASGPFFDAVESEFYSYMVQCLLGRHLAEAPTTRVVELGSGTGTPVIDAIARTDFRGHVQGWDINSEAVAVSNANAIEAGVQAHYRVSHGDFFDCGARSGERYAVGNPPYLPCLTDDIADPGLWGGPDGNDVAHSVLSLDFAVVMLIVSSLADPAAVLRHAASRGYRVIDWAVRPVTMGRFSREPAVYHRIMELQNRKRAHTRGAVYAIAGVTWRVGRGDDEAELVLRALEAVAGQ
jgi:methylase of polypeptide subunit release factors